MKKTNQNKPKGKKELDEFVDADGTFIDGDNNTGADEVSVSSDNTCGPTTDDYVKQLQGPRKLGYGYSSQRISESNFLDLLESLFEKRKDKDSFVKKEISKVDQVEDMFEDLSDEEKAQVIKRLVTKCKSKDNG